MEILHCNNCGTDNKTNAKYCSQCGYELERIIADKNDTKLVSNSAKANRGKVLGSIFGVIGFAVTYFVIQQIFFKAPSFDKVLVSNASEINKTCPMMVDEFTRLDNTLALPNNIFQYNYTLINISKTEVNIDTVKKYIEPGIINGVRTSPDLKIFRDNKTTMVYNYRDKNGEFVHKLSVTPDMYRD